ncbi:MAG TPA: CPBP family intramembrane glutamic endopeptidase [Actinophytocola sp.]|uniref:CPBP family intramembrane glutamic endopeptidase n=1 Tax=Actinophytocola sp. TaxID=1872138 RepID=UPI002DDCB62F|nr:CPBP family intramembrane glutamic endopeptidase [Actinophytocola sp.]HEV2780658.1 CPBP family intramembrane glutamic endopeptidase [Actinophytocola sp.]
MLVGEPSQPAVVSRARQIWLLVEYGVLFFALAGVYTLIGHPGSPVPFLVLSALGVVLYLRSRPDFDRRDFLRPRAIRGQLRPVLTLWALAAVAVLLALLILSPGRLFELPRRDPIVWVIVLVAYPLLSVYPQELIFCGFLFHRYAPVFGTGNGFVAASAAAFGFVHIIYGQWLSVVLTVILGAVLARRFARTRSLAVVWLEHALYGLLAFTVGLGSFFYNGAGD